MNVAQSGGKTILLVGPSFLQLNIAKLLHEKGHFPMIVAPQVQLDNFKKYLYNNTVPEDERPLCNDDQLTIGLPDLPLEPELLGGNNVIDGVIFTAEEALITPAALKAVLSFEGFGKTGPRRAICVLPIKEFVNKEKSMSWIPIMNNDKKEAEVWKAFERGWDEYAYSRKRSPTTVRVGSLLGGSVDGPEALKTTGLNECISKMSLEQYRDMKELAFDRHRNGVQLIQGDGINVKPEGQKKLEEKNLKGEALEEFRISNGYPEQDRSNRHSVAYAVVETYFRENAGELNVGDMEGKCLKEFTILATASALPTKTKEWDALFAQPGPAAWPDPETFVKQE